MDRTEGRGQSLMLALIALSLSLPSSALAGSASSRFFVTASVVPTCAVRGQTVVCTRGVMPPRITGGSGTPVSSAPPFEQGRESVDVDRGPGGARSVRITVNF